jgi:eukaryotic-like serine/threonine-protein kinase
MSDVLKPGQAFAGRYRIEKFLAKGGFGAVYVAEQVETELRVALKVLWPHVLFSEDAVTKFKLEARIAGRVGSEHIVRVFDAGFDDESRMPFLVMELLTGEELQRKVEREGPLQPGRVVSYMRQIASALDKAHGYVDRDGSRSPIVHRDLKPDNLFLADRESGDPIVKILDFGIAKILSDSTQMSQEVKGTPLYMAFEQASAGQITPQTDIWPLGLIGFYLLTGRCYWRAGNNDGASLTQLFGEVLSLPIDPPSQRARELAASVVPTPEFDRWFARCVNRDPAERFKTAGECASTLSAALGRSSDGRQSAGAQLVSNAAAGAGAALEFAATALPAAEPPRVATTADSIALGQTKAPEVPRRGPVVLGVAIAGAFVVGGVLTAVGLRDRTVMDPPGASSGSLGIQPSPRPPPTAETTSTVQSASTNTPPLASSNPTPVEQPIPSPQAAAGGRKGIPTPPRPSANVRPAPPPPTATATVKRSGIYDDR